MAFYHDLPHRLSELFVFELLHRHFAFGFVVIVELHAISQLCCFFEFDNFFFELLEIMLLLAHKDRGGYFYL